MTFTPDTTLALATTHQVTIAGATSVGDSGVQQFPVSFSFTTVTPVEAINQLKADVYTLRDNGVLNQGQANSLLVKLNGAINKLNRGQDHVAVMNKLNAFINRVQSFVRPCSAPSPLT